MKNKIVKLIAAFFLGLGMSALYAQETIPSSGGNAIGSGGWVSYTVGQIVYNTITGSNGSVAQGVQQPFEISATSGLEEAECITLQCEVYPNPSTDFLKLKVDGSILRHLDKNNTMQQGSTFIIQSLSYQLFDINEKLLESRKIENNETIIVVKDLMPSIYFLRVVQAMSDLSVHEIKTFKIVKN